MTTETAAAFLDAADKMAAALADDTLLGWDDTRARRQVLSFADQLIGSSDLARIVPADELAAMRADTVGALAAHWGIDQ